MRCLRSIAIIGLIIGLGTTSVLAAQSKSTNYEVTEVQFGSGGLLNASSANYKAQENLGSNIDGSAKSTHYGANSGFLTPNTPFLQMVVNPATINLGTLNSSSAATGTATFSVRAYVDSGYVVMSMNSSPTNEDGVALKNMSTAAVSNPGTEQYGINLVQNLTTCTNPAPANFGANPSPIPTSAYATGQAANGYNTCGLFKYNVGDVIAQTTTSGAGETDYTISYLVNINSLSKAGHYNMTQNLVAVATF
jgi:hypothetical protein